MTAAEMREKAAQKRREADQLTEDALKPADRTAMRKAITDAPAYVHPDTLRASKPFSVAKAVGLVARKISPDKAKTEDEWCGRFQKSLYEVYGYEPADIGNRMIPFGFDLLPADLAQTDDMRVLKSMMAAAVVGYDPEEAAHYRRQFLMKADPLSPFVDHLGGALIPPAQLGEIITLYRNIEVMTRAGAAQIALPPNGKINFPRQTGVTSAVWLNEPVNLSGSNGQTNPTFGNLSLEAKKLGAYLIVNNDVFRFGQSAAIEGLARTDLARTLALTMDLALLEGTGSPGRPKGLINYDILSYSALNTGTNGDTISQEDGYLAAAKVEETADEAEFEKWIMRPLMHARIGSVRSDAVVPGDAQGSFVAQMMRGLAEGLPPSWAGYPVVKSNQVSRSRTKGSASNLTYILGGRFSDYLVGTFGALEFAQAEQTNFLQDQTAIRAIMFGDGAPRRTNSFVKIDSLVFQ